MEYFAIGIMALITFTLLILAIILIIKQVKNNHSYTTYPQTEAKRPEKVLCPYCQEVMEPGYSIATRGLAFRNINSNPSHIIINNLLSNTLNYTFRVKENAAWHCPKCEVVTIDHSALVGKK
jgi:hypothetical protein